MAARQQGERAWKDDAVSYPVYSRKRFGNLEEAKDWLDTIYILMERHGVVKPFVSVTTGYYHDKCYPHERDFEYVYQDYVPRFPTDLKLWEIMQELEKVRKITRDMMALEKLQVKTLRRSPRLAKNKRFYW